MDVNLSQTPSPTDDPLSPENSAQKEIVPPPLPSRPWRTQEKSTQHVETLFQNYFTTSKTPLPPHPLPPPSQSQSTLLHDSLSDTNTKTETETEKKADPKTEQGKERETVTIIKSVSTNRVKKEKPVLFFDPNSKVGEPLLIFPSVKGSADLMSLTPSSISSISPSTSPLLLIRDHDTTITVDDPPQTVVLRNAVLQYEDVRLAIGPSSAVFSPKFGTYLFFKDYYFLVFDIEISSDEDKKQVIQFERLLNELVIFQKLEDVFQIDVSATPSAPTVLHTTAEKIESTGESIGKTLINTAAILGKGIRTTSAVFRSRTEGVGSANPEEELTEKELSSYEFHKQNSNAVYQVSEKVITAVSNGLDYVGGVVVQGVSLSYNKSKEVYDSTEYATLKKYEKGEAPPSNSYASGLWDITKASFRALGHLTSGVTHAGISLATDVRDVAIEQTEHRQGTAQAQRLYQRLEIGSRIGLTALNVTELYGYVSIRSAAALGYKVGTKLGKSVSNYDQEKHNILFGAPWKMGWASLRHNVLQGFKAHWLILRTFSLAWYSSPNDNWDSPVDYVKLSTIKKVCKVSEDITHKRYCFEIVTKSRIMFVSVECNDLDSHWSNFLKKFEGPSLPSSFQVPLSIVPPLLPPPSAVQTYPLSNPFSISDGEKASTDKETKTKTNGTEIMTETDPQTKDQTEKENLEMASTEGTTEKTGEDNIDGGETGSEKSKEIEKRVTRQSFHSRISVFGSKRLSQPHHSWLIAEMEHWIYMISDLSSFQLAYLQKNVSSALLLTENPSVSQKVSTLTVPPETAIGKGSSP